MVEDGSKVSQELRPDYVTQQFVQIYYQILSDRPVDLYRFYKSESLSYFADGPEEQATVLEGEQSIRNFQRHDFQGCKIEFSAIDSQWSATNNILLLVCGFIYRKSESHGRSFVHSFLLSPQTNGWYVRNDMFRYMDARAEGDLLIHEEAESCNGGGVAAEISPAIETSREQSVEPSDLVQPDVSDVQSGLVDPPQAVVMDTQETADFTAEEEPVESEPVEEEAVEEAAAVAGANKVSTAPLESTVEVTEGSVNVLGPGPDEVVESEEKSADSTRSAAPPKFSYASIVLKTTGRVTPAATVGPTVPKTATESRTGQQESTQATARGAEGDGGSGNVVSGNDSGAARGGTLPLPGVYVRQLPNPRSVSGSLSDLLYAEFERYGNVRNVDVRANRGFAFVDYDSEESVSIAVAAWAADASSTAHESIRKIKVSVRRPPPPRNVRGTDQRNPPGSTTRSGSIGRGRGRGPRGRGDSSVVEGGTGDDSRRGGRGQRRPSNAEISTNRTNQSHSTSSATRGNRAARTTTHSTTEN